jgi:hypothetical protein
MIDTLTPGVTYGFKIQSRNAFGLSEFSSVFYILCGTVPESPTAPVTTSVGSDIKISWIAPNNNGAQITGYNVLIMASNGTYIKESVHC